MLDLTPHLVALQVKLKELASDASPLLGGETIIFVEIDLHKDEIFDSLFNNETNEPILELYTQMALELWRYVVDSGEAGKRLARRKIV